MHPSIEYYEERIAWARKQSPHLSTRVKFYNKCDIYQDRFDSKVPKSLWETIWNEIDAPESQ